MKKGNFFKKYVQFPALRVIKNTTARRIIWWVIFFIISFSILATNFIPDQVKLQAGEVAKKDVYYQGGTLTYTSEIKTGEVRTKAAQEVEQIFRVDPQVLKNLEEKISSLFDKISAIKNDETLDNQLEQVEKLKTLLPESIPQTSLLALTNAGDGTLKLLEEELKGIIRTRMQEGVAAGQLDAVRQQISSDIEALDIKAPFKKFLQETLKSLNLGPNKVYDPVETANAVEQQLSQVKPVQVTVKSGEKIVEKGTVVSEEQIEALQILGLQRNKAPFLTFVGLFGFLVIIYVLIVVYLNAFHREFLKLESNIILLGLLINVTLFIAKIVTVINISDRPEYAAQLGYLIPVAACSMLIAILLDTKLALFITVVMGLLTGVITSGQVTYGIVAVIGSMVGIYRVSRLSQRAQLVHASIHIGVVNAITIIFLGLMWNQATTVIGLGIIMGLINGILASILTIGFLPFLESAFGITTSVKLLELSNPNHPLLKRLMMEAPGTYHHSILVGNLAEAAADAIDADSLLVRIGSYFHDIGKVKRPYFFIENQIPTENPHDKIAPTLSTLIITSHIKDGVELAREHKFPRVLIDIIEQHHGTSLVSYFYHKAKEGEKPENVSESDFRYQNSKPQTRETAIIMLADSVQAAVHVLQKPTKGHLEAKVREIIRQKLQDGQLEECELHFKDLETIAQAFVRVLNGMFHQRIEYPDQVTKEMERSKSKNGSANKEQAGQDSGHSGDGKTPEKNGTGDSTAGKPES